MIMMMVEKLMGRVNKPRQEMLRLRGKVRKYDGQWVIIVHAYDDGTVYFRHACDGQTFHTRMNKLK